MGNSSRRHVLSCAFTICVLLAVVAVGCGQDQSLSTSTEIAATPAGAGEAATSAPTAAATPTSAVSLLPGVELSSALAALEIGGSSAAELSAVLDLPSSSPQELTLLDAIKLASTCWDQEIDYRALDDVDDLLPRLYWLLALAQASGIDGGLVVFDGVVPGAEGLRFYRQVFSTLPNDVAETTLAEALPRGAVLRQGTGLVVVAGDDERWLVCFSEAFDRRQAGMQPIDTPRLYLALISDDDLAALLGERYEPGTGRIQFVDADGHTVDWEINTLEGGLAAQVEETAGQAWADQGPEGGWFINPVIPYPSPELLSQFEGQEIRYQKTETGGWEGVRTDANREDKIALVCEYREEEDSLSGEKNGVWEWKEYFEIPQWVQEMIPSNAIAEYNEADNVWELYSTVRTDENSDEDRGLYIASIESVADQNGAEIGRYCNYTEGPLYPNDHPELFVEESWEEIRQRMQETGMEKVLFFDIEQVDHIKVKRYPDSQNLPLALVTYFRHYPVEIYYPYITESQVVPAVSPRTQLAILINNNDRTPIGLKIFDNEFDIFTQPTSQSERIITDEESLVGESGTIASLGTPLLRINDGYISLLGRSVIDNNYNRMLLDLFIQDGKGRLIVPRV